MSRVSGRQRQQASNDGRRGRFLLSSTSDPTSVPAPTRHISRFRWSCDLCFGFGYADTQDHAVAEFEQHYWDKHRPEDE